jgi:hypothetical protein
MVRETLVTRMPRTVSISSLGSRAAWSWIPRRALLPRDGDLEDAAVALPDPVDGRGIALAQSGAVPAGEHRRRPAAVEGDPCVAHRIHASMNHVEAADLHAVVDRLPREAQPLQLPAGNDPVLPCSELGDRVIQRSWLLFAPIIGVNCNHSSCGDANAPA